MGKDRYQKLENNILLCNSVILLRNSAILNNDTRNNHIWIRRIVIINHWSTTQNFSRCHSNFFLSLFGENKTWHLFESSAGQMIHIKSQALFSLKKYKIVKIKMFSVAVVISTLSINFLASIKFHWNQLGDTVVINFSLTLCMLGKNFARQHYEIFSYFSQKIGFNISCKLSPRRQFAWNVKTYYLGKIKYFKMSSAEIFTQHAKP